MSKLGKGLVGALKEVKEDGLITLSAFPNVTALSKCEQALDHCARGLEINESLKKEMATWDSDFSNDGLEDA